MTFKVRLLIDLLLQLQDVRKGRLVRSAFMGCGILLVGLTGISCGDDSLPAWAWWPAQTLPKGLVQAPVKLYEHDHGGALSKRAQSMLVASLAGLAAQGVNENRFDELVWFDPGTTSPSYAQWLSEIGRAHV